MGTSLGITFARGIEVFHLKHSTSIRLLAHPSFTLLNPLSPSRGQPGFCLQMWLRRIMNTLPDQNFLCLFHFRSPLNIMTSFGTLSMTVVARVHGPTAILVDLSEGTWRCNIDWGQSCVTIIWGLCLNSEESNNESTNSWISR
jgi:hypothetical protein